MNILLITLGSRGDINPFICLGNALKKRGHEATIISSEIHQHIVTSADLNFIPCNTASEYFDVINNADFYDARKSFGIIAKYMSLGPMRTIYDIISKYDQSDTILVTTQFMLGARIASQKLGIPLITVCLQPMSFWSVVQPPIYPGAPLQKLPKIFRKLILSLTDKWLMDKTLAPKVNQFRNELGLPNVNKIFSKWMFSPQKIIGLFPEWFASPASDWPKQTELTGFLHYDENADHPLPENVVNFISGREPPLILTYGTATTQCQYFFRIFIEAARILKQRVLLLTQHANQLPPLDSNHEIHIPYISLQKVLTHASVIIHHGGIGTLFQSLSTATPQLIVPLSHDQFDNAARLEKIGAGLSLTSKKYSVNDAINKIQRLLKSDEIRGRCLFYSKKISFLSAEQRTCDIIEEIGANKT
jgi:rhamnosyltransferase subunit B